jgi:anti-anti-sigma factor
VGKEVTVTGRLDVTTVDEVRREMHAILDRGFGDLLVHLAQAEVHDAAGLGVIVGIHHRARGMGRRLILVDVSPRLDRLLRASRLHRVLARGPGQGVVAEVPVAVAEAPDIQAEVPDIHAEVPDIHADGPVTYAGGPDTGAPVAEAEAPLTDPVSPLTD